MCAAKHLVFESNWLGFGFSEGEKKKKKVCFSGFFLSGEVTLGSMVMAVKWQRSCGPVIKF